MPVQPVTKARVLVRQGEEFPGGSSALQRRFFSGSSASGSFAAPETSPAPYRPERRRSARHALGWVSVVRHDPDGEGERWLAEVRDLSATGVGLELPGLLPAGGRDFRAGDEVVLEGLRVASFRPGEGVWEYELVSVSSPLRARLHTPLPPELLDRDGSPRVSDFGPAQQHHPDQPSC